MNWHRQKTADGNPLSPAHKVSFSDSSKSSEKRNSGRPSSRPSSSSNSHTESPAPPRRKNSQQRLPSQTREKHWASNRNTQLIDRQSEALWQTTLTSPTSPQPKPFLIYHDSFLRVLGPNPTLQCLIDDPRAPYFHEAGVFHPPTNTLFITSNQIPDPSPDAVSTAHKTIIITKLEFFAPTDFTRDKVRCPERNYMANGGTNYRDGLILCAQGSLREPAGLIYMEAKRPHKTTTLLNNYHSRPFNSPNDVVVHSDGSIWFTDPIYGYEQGFRPKPQLPQLVYRFDPSTGDVRAVADNFGRPNGIAFSPDENTLYVTDTDCIHGHPSSPPTPSPTRAASIYAFTVAKEPQTSLPYLTSRRLFAYVDSGAPDGIKCDGWGNVYAGCGDGIQVWNCGGMLIGKVMIEGGVSNFCFGRGGEVWACGERRLWRVGFGKEVRGGILGL